MVGDLFRIYALAQREGATFQWITIAEGVELQGAETFDPVRMSELYEIGYRTARAGPEWELHPPAFRTEQPPP